MMLQIDVNIGESRSATVVCRDGIVTLGLEDPLSFAVVELPEPALEELISSLQIARDTAYSAAKDATSNA